jgi:hypothetical protein
LPEWNDGALSIVYGKTTGAQPCSRCTMLTPAVVYLAHEDGRAVTNVVHLCWLCKLQGTPQPRAEMRANTENNMTAHNGNQYRKVNS